MTLFSRLKKRYPHVDPKILRQYKPAEKYVVFNDGDADLHPIEYKMPEPPAYHLIDGFGKPASEQIFRRERMPEKLEALTKRVPNMNDMWAELDDNRSYYSEELKWIYRQWWHRLNGYWFFNDGVPTYITGQNWFWLNWWKLDVGYPDYLYRDRIFFLFAKYCMETTTATFFYRVWDNKSDEYMHFSNEAQAEKFKEKLGLESRIEHGEYTVDYGKRVCYGFNYPKFRREGATSKAACINYEMMSRTINEKSYIQSKDETSAFESVYKKILYGFKNMPFFFLPQYKGSTDPRDGIEFKPPAQKIGAKGGILNFNIGLESGIFYETADSYAVDGERGLFYHGDETGKYNNSAPYNLIERWGVAKKILTRGDEIFGLCINTSTSGDTKGEGGRNYRDLCSDSHWEERNPITGTTKSGLFNLFISSEVNFGSYTDKHGNPIIETPTREQRQKYKIKVGAREYLAAALDNLEEEPAQYNQQMRDFPRSFREAFMSSAQDSGFNIKKLSSTIANLEMNRKVRPVVGNLMWNKEYEEVEFIENINGKFKIYQFPIKPNAKVVRRGGKEPANNDVYVMGADPAKFEKKKAGGKKSLAAAAVRRRKDETIDSDEDNKFVAVYEYDVLDMELFYQDMMMMSVWYGVSIFPEQNVGDIEQRFKNVGLKKYLKYRYVNGRKADRAGVYTDNNFKQQIFVDYMNFIENDIVDGETVREPCIEILRQCRDIEGMDDMTNYDLFTAGGLCFLSLRNDPPRFDYYRRKQQDRERSDDAVVDYILRSRRK